MPVIGGLEPAKVRPGHIRAVLAGVQTRGLSAATLAQVRSVLGSALRQAVAEGLITANAVAAVKRPRVQRRELRWPTSAQLRALVDASRRTMWEAPILLAAVTGAPPGGGSRHLLGGRRSQDGHRLYPPRRPAGPTLGGDDREVHRPEDETLAPRRAASPLRSGAHPATPTRAAEAARDARPQVV